LKEDAEEEEEEEKTTQSGIKEIPVPIRGRPNVRYSVAALVE